MEADRAAPTAFQSHRGAVQVTQLVAPGDHRRQAVLEKAAFLPRPESGQHQNRLADACLPQLRAFGRAGYAEPVGSGSCQCLGHRHGAMPVGVGLNHGKDSPPTTPLRRRVDVALDGAEVVLECAQPHLSPHGATVKPDLHFLRSRHERFPMRVVQNATGRHDDAKRALGLVNTTVRKLQSGSQTGGRRLE